MPSSRTGLWLHERQNDAIAERRLLISSLPECSFPSWFPLASACF
ncbi:hypothetical protein B4113_0629 [Geobacillus sp. B4113_201601]|nr:hypothetical protein B4113_0629 [Geobacillus sp. B4113_201601]